MAQLAYIFRISIKTKTLETNNPSNLFRFVVKHVGITRQGKIPFDMLTKHVKEFLEKGLRKKGIFTFSTIPSACYRTRDVQTKLL
ncbi:hypothetical protein [Tunicatimonas pelagia]|uniref:hypothetical protein n=1 Tax=Tunicatimonas pelagia TaxID=931531 RepID=UPI0026667E2C|nr:hypothetical protein [Tunicatimonas pelagia]WKN44844.1 hypothetical protein P0M28_07690 [Tunicatimonas pelagia]